MIDIQNYQSPNYKIDSIKWHKYSAWYYGLIVFIVSYAVNNFWMVIPLGISRGVFFPVFLNLVRTEKKGTFYLSDTGYDGQLKALMGEKAGLYQFVFLFSILILSNIFILWTLHFH